ncbi:MAG TPA: hypothetical protein VFX61_04340 [Micromonosporaceae bacterium]|nr:hypothetical protein [Micromonosporaceae bacterium]
MRGRISVISAGLLLLTGCGGEASVALPTPSVAVTKLPASAAGGVCKLLDFGVIEEVTGAQFDVSAARSHKKTQTCVVQTEATSWPDLLLSVTQTSADTAVFTAEMVPQGARTVKGIGKAAYQLTIAPGKVHGGAVEVAWLRDNRVFCLRHTFSKGTDKAAAEKFAPKLIELAKRLDATKP